MNPKRLNHCLILQIVESQTRRKKKLWKERKKERIKSMNIIEDRIRSNKVIYHEGITCTSLGA